MKHFGHMVQKCSFTTHTHTPRNKHLDKKKKKKLKSTNLNRGLYSSQKFSVTSAKDQGSLEAFII